MKQHVRVSPPRNAGKTSHSVFLLIKVSCSPPTFFSSFKRLAGNIGTRTVYCLKAQWKTKTKILNFAVTIYLYGTVQLNFIH
jgi:hypothetical protein